MTHAIGNLPGMARRVLRRGFLQVGALGSLGPTWPDALRSVAANEPPRGTARSAILIFLGGRLSHHDMFDPKPNAAYGMMTSPKTQAAFNLGGEEAATRERYRRRSSVSD